MEHVREISRKWTQSKGLPYETWRHERLLIVIKSKASNEADDCDQTAMIKLDGKSSEEDTWLWWRLRFHIGRSRFIETLAHCGDVWTAREFLISIERTTILRDRMAGRLRRRLARDRSSIAARSWLDHAAIVARLNRDHGSYMAKSWHTISPPWWAMIVVKS